MRNFEVRYLFEKNRRFEKKFMNFGKINRKEFKIEYAKFEKIVKFEEVIGF